MMTAFVASLAIFAFAWVERGYKPRVRIEGQSTRFKGQYLSPLAFSPKGDVLAACRILRKMGKEGATAVPVLKKNLGDTRKFWIKHPDVLEALDATLESIEPAK